MAWLRSLLVLVALCPALAAAQADPSSEGAPAPGEAPVAPLEAPVAPPAPPGVFPAKPPAPGGAAQDRDPRSDPQRARLLEEIERLDLRMASLREQRREVGLTAPAVVTAVGYGVAFVAGAVALAEWSILRDIQDGDCGSPTGRSAYRYASRCDLNDDGVVDGDDKHAARVLARSFGTLSAVAAGVGVAGTVFLLRRLAKRRAFEPELRELRGQRHQLLQQLRYDGGYAHGVFQISLRGRF